MVLLLAACTSPNPDYDAVVAEPTAASSTGLTKGDRCDPKHDLCGGRLRCCAAVVERDGTSEREDVCLPEAWCTDRGEGE